jgi:hypothetical protein
MTIERVQDGLEMKGKGRKERRAGEEEVRNCSRKAKRRKGI